MSAVLTRWSLRGRLEQESDECLVKRVLDGALDVFAVLMRRHNQRLYRVVRGITGNDATAEDVLQQAYVSAYRHLHQFEGRSRFGTWLTKIAVREAVRVRRREAAAYVHDREVWAQVIAFPSSTEDRMSAREWARLLERTIDEIPESYRSVLVLRSVDQLSTEETAEILGLSPENVRVRLHRARKLLEEALFERNGSAIEEVYEFGGHRCDRTTARVMDILGLVTRAAPATSKARRSSMALRICLWIVVLAMIGAAHGCGDSSGGEGGVGGTGGSSGTGGRAGTGGVGGTGGTGGVSDLIERGREIFRYDTFGDEAVWTDVLQMHDVIAAAVDPMTALGVGLKVDAGLLPDGILETADLSDPATTVALLKLDAVVGVIGTVEAIDGKDTLVSVGITCALCHSTVDDSVIPGIGRRLDGWPNRDLDPGLILSLSPAFQDEETQAVLRSWGPGKYDAYWNFDGLNDPQVIPPAYGLAGVDLETFTGEGEVSYWNAYVAVTQMGGQGTFVDERLGIDISAAPDLVTPKLPALRAYQLSLPAPRPPDGSFDLEAASRGRALFEGTAQCSGCHRGEQLTDANQRLHSAEEVGQDPTLASRGTTGMYRTTPLRGAWQHPPYFHDGSAANLDEVVEHYDELLALGLNNEQKSDLVQYLSSL